VTSSIPLSYQTARIHADAARHAPDGRIAIGVIDATGQFRTSTKGLGRSLMRTPMYAKRPRIPGPVFTLNHAAADTSVMRDRRAELENTFKDYAGSGMIFLAVDKELTDLTFTLSGKNASQPIRALTRQGSQSFEIRSTGASSARPHPMECPTELWARFSAD
jgi:hypothetical protein